MCHRTAGVAAGLGEFGWSKVFLTKKFGPLQRLGIVLTDADLPSDPLQIKQICDRCMACVRACPAHAIPKDKSESVNIAGEKIEHAKVDMYRCAKAHGGGIKETHPSPPDDFDISEIDTKFEALRRKSKDDTDDYVLGEMALGEVSKKYPHPLFGLVSGLGLACAHCGALGCYRACLEHLEKRGILDRKFVNEYRSISKEADVSLYKERQSAGIIRKAGGKEVYME